MGFFSKLFGVRKEEDEEPETPKTETGEEIVEDGGSVEEGTPEEGASEEPIV